jgi:LemA protein
VAKQEVAVFTAIAEARTRYSGATSVSDKVAATNQMESALARLMVIVENYPELKSQQNFLTLQSQIEGTENRISVERGRFNDLVRAFNTKVKVFPANIVASIFGLGEREYFEAATGAEQAPEVNF